MVKVKARDEYGVQSDWSETIQVLIVPNSPPVKPTITGPKTGKQSKLFNFKFTATDPENQQVYYWISWGGDVYPETYGPYSSGESPTISHSWSTIGDHTINAKTIDQYGAKSGITIYQITIINSKVITNPVFLKVLQNIIDRFPILKNVIYIVSNR